MIAEKDFDNLFNTLVTKVMENGHQGKRKLFDAISDVYEIKEYIPEILLFEKRVKCNLFYFKYTEKCIELDNKTFYNRMENPIGDHRDYKFEITNEVDLKFTLNSFDNFFKFYLSTNDDLIDKNCIEQVILPAIELLLKYIKEN